MRPVICQLGDLRPGDVAAPCEKRETAEDIMSLLGNPAGLADGDGAEGPMYTFFLVNKGVLEEMRKNGHHRHWCVKLNTEASGAS